MLNPIPAVIDASNSRFQATERGVMSIERHNNVSDVVARKALMLFCRRPSRSPSRTRSIPGCARSVCRFPSPNPPCSRREIFASTADHVASLPAIGGTNAARAGINQIARMNNGEVYGKMVGLITSKTAVVAIPKPTTLRNARKNELLAICPLFIRKRSLLTQASRVRSRGSSFRAKPWPYGSGKDLMVRRVRATMDSSSGSI